MRCKWWDCGWCYAPDGKQSNDDNGQCNKPEQCRELERQEHKQWADPQAVGALHFGHHKPRMLKLKNIKVVLK